MCQKIPVRTGLEFFNCELDAFDARGSIETPIQPKTIQNIDAYAGLIAQVQAPPQYFLPSDLLVAAQRKRVGYSKIREYLGEGRPILVRQSHVGIDLEEVKGLWAVSEEIMTTIVLNDARQQEHGAG